MMPSRLRENGVIGCAGIGFHRQARLCDWAMGRGARALFDGDGFGLWVLGAPIGGMAPIDAAPLQGVLIGDLFPREPGEAPSAADIPAGYRQHGQALVWSLLGQYALILWDRERRELGLYRDDSSARTLYYRRQGGGGLVFSDRLDILVDSPFAARNPSPDAVHEYLRLFDISTPRTIYDGVFCVDPDELLLYGRHGLQSRERPAEPIAPLRPATLSEAAEALDQRLGLAVERRMPRDSETLVFLSGGVDSAYLCALAAAHSPAGVRAITVGFDSPELDETPVATAIASALGVPHEVLRFSLDDYRDAFDQLASEGEYPFADPAGPATLLSYQHARRYGDVALDGTGADTLVGIMPARHQRIATAYAARLPPWLRRALTAGIAPIPRLRDYRPLLDFDDPEEVLSRWHGYRRREIERLCGQPANLQDSRFYRIYRSFPPQAHFERYSALFGNLPDDRIHLPRPPPGWFSPFSPARPAPPPHPPGGVSLATHPTNPPLKGRLPRPPPPTRLVRPYQGLLFPLPAPSFSPGPPPFSPSPPTINSAPARHHR